MAPSGEGACGASPLIEHAAHLLRTIYDDPESARTVGARVRRAIGELLSPMRVGQIAAEALTPRD